MCSSDLLDEHLPYPTKILILDRSGDEIGLSGCRDPLMKKTQTSTETQHRHNEMALYDRPHTIPHNNHALKKYATTL